MRLAIKNLSAEERQSVRESVHMAMQYWPNSHLGDLAPREDMREAFRMIRNNTILTGVPLSGMRHGNA